LANQFYFEEMLLFKNTEMQVWKSQLRSVSKSIGEASRGGRAAAGILRHGSAAQSPTTFNRLALSLKIFRPAISDEISDQKFFS